MSEIVAKGWSINKGLPRDYQNRIPLKKSLRWNAGKPNS